jgi:hypothetical protein
MNERGGEAYAGEDRRSARGEILTEAELEKLAKRVADSSVHAVFELLGLDVKDHKEREKVRADLAFLREMRAGVAEVKSSWWKSLGTAIVVLIVLGFIAFTKKNGG